MAKTVFRRNFIGLNTFIRKQSLKINEQSIQIEKLRGNPHQTPINKKKEIIKAEIIKVQKQNKKVTKPKDDSLKRFDNTDIC